MPPTLSRRRGRIGFSRGQSWRWEAASSVASAVLQSGRSGVQSAVAWWTREMEEDTHRERRLRRRQQAVSCCKSVIAFLFSHIGLAAMVVAYAILGGFLFQALEAPHEISAKLVIRSYKEKKVMELKALTSFLSQDDANLTNFTNNVRRIFVEFQERVTVAVKNDGWDGRDTLDADYQQWSFAGALLYAVTVITTIGYGHIAPKTVWGRLITIMYALIGIPLTFLYLSNIGNFLADCFRLFYKKICCDVLCCQQCDRRKKHKMRLMRKRNLAMEQLKARLGLKSDDLTNEGEDNKNRSANQDVTRSNDSLDPNENNKRGCTSEAETVITGADEEIGKLPTCDTFSSMLSVESVRTADSIDCASIGDMEFDSDIGNAKETDIVNEFETDIVSVKETNIDDDEIETDIVSVVSIKETNIDSSESDSDVLETDIVDDSKQLIEHSSKSKDTDDKETDIVDEEDDELKIIVVNESSDAALELAFTNKVLLEIDESIRNHSPVSDIVCIDFSDPQICCSLKRCKETDILVENISEDSQSQTEVSLKETPITDETYPEIHFEVKVINNEEEIETRSNNVRFDKLTVFNNHGYTSVDTNCIDIELPEEISAENLEINSESKHLKTNGLLGTLLKRPMDIYSNNILPKITKLKLYNLSSMIDKINISKVVPFKHSNTKDTDNCETEIPKIVTIENIPKCAEIKPKPDKIESMQTNGSPLRRSHTLPSVAHNRKFSTAAQPSHGATMGRSARRTPSTLSPEMGAPKHLYTGSELLRMRRRLANRNTLPKVNQRSPEEFDSRGRSLGSRMQEVRRHIQVPMERLLRSTRRGNKSNSSVSTLQSAEPLLSQNSKASMADNIDNKQIEIIDDADEIYARENHSYSNLVLGKPYSSQLTDSAFSDGSFKFNTSLSRKESKICSKRTTSSTGESSRRLSTVEDAEATNDDGFNFDDGDLMFLNDPFYFDDDLLGRDEDDDDHKVTVPISICLVIIFAYILAGSVLFTLWEDWDLLTGSYFCFITLSTIGFGDIVPGTDMAEWNSHEKLVLCALWLAFGLSLLAMCFNLMQEEVKEKFRWLGKKLGLLKEEGE